MNLFSLSKTEKDAVQFLQSKYIIPTIMYCEKQHVMNLYFGLPICWNCSNSTCRKKVNIRNGNFNGKKSRYVMKNWELTRIQLSNGIITWKICVQDLLKKPKQKIEGEGLIVEIDESLFTTRKNNAGRVLLHSGFLEDYVVKLINVFRWKSMIAV